MTKTNKTAHGQRRKRAVSATPGGGLGLREPTAAERAAIEAIGTKAAKPARAALRLTAMPGEPLEISPPHADAKGWGAHVCDTFGTSSTAFADQALNRVLTVVRGRGDAAPTQTEANAALAIMGAIAPSDELEAAIGEQFIAAHSLTMDLFAKAKHADLMPKLESYTTLANKTARTAATLVEALAKLRSGGKQTHEVRYVYVNGPAVFGDYAQTLVGAPPSGGGRGIQGQPHEPSTFPGVAALEGLPMRGADACGLGLPGPSDPREAQVQASRGPEPWRSQGPRQWPVPDGLAHAGDDGGPPDREGPGQTHKDNAR